MSVAHRIMGSIMSAVVWAASTTAVHACPICFGIDDGPTASGVRAAVVVLMGVTTAVLAGFAVFIARFVRRAIDGRPADGQPLS